MVGHPPARPGRRDFRECLHRNRARPTLKRLFSSLERAESNANGVRGYAVDRWTR